MGGHIFSAAYRAQLADSLDKVYSQYLALNERKNFFALVGSPLILLSFSLLTVAASRVLGVLGIESLANTLQTLTTTTMLLLVFYIGARYTGNYPRFVQLVDQVVERAWRQAWLYWQRHLMHPQAIQFAQLTARTGVQRNEERPCSLRKQAVQVNLLQDESSEESSE